MRTGGTGSPHEQRQVFPEKIIDELCNLFRCRATEVQRGSVTRRS